MRNRILLVIGLLYICCELGAQPIYKKAYTLFDNNGVEIGYDKMIKELAESDVVLIGEIHNCVITHWLELEITKSLYAIHGSKLMIGAEMFETDNQLIMDEYMNHIIDFERFEDEARLWPNFSTDYYPFVFFAKEHKIPFIATNVPRRYASIVKNKGLTYLDSLPEESKKYFPPLPIKYDEKKRDYSMFNMMHMIGKGGANTEFLAQAQAIKDATMGWFIAKSMKSKFLHFNGNYHSDYREGIVPYLLEYSPQTSIKTVCALRQENINQLDEENKGRADFYICVPEDMTYSY